MVPDADATNKPNILNNTISSYLFYRNFILIKWIETLLYPQSNSFSNKIELEKYIGGLYCSKEATLNKAFFMTQQLIMTCFVIE